MIPQPRAPGLKAAYARSPRVKLLMAQNIGKMARVLDAIVASEPVVDVIGEQEKKDG